ncbi:MAG: restriction endonuclease [Candidatus Omnitrophica bacterium]|nr:restriction endonuclease [Candidatus Omnitrophota bacterium]
MESFPLSLSLRDSISARIQKRIEDLQKGYRQNVGLISRSGLGKTHLLLSLYQAIPKNSNIIPVYLAADILGFEHFAECWIGALLSGLFVSQGVPYPKNFASLLQASEPIVPKTLEKIRHFKKIMRHEKNAACVKELFALPTVLAEETGKKILFILDEFQALISLPAPDPFGLLGKEIMIGKNTLYLAASSTPERAKEIFRDKLSMLFGNFEVIEMMPFSFEETAEFLTEKFPLMTFTDMQKKFFIRMTDGNPSYLSFLGEQIAYLMARDFSTEVSNDYVLQAFHHELFDDHGRLSLKFENRLEACMRLAKDRYPYVGALLAIASGRRKVLGISTFIQRAAGETKTVLQRLVHEDIICKRGSFYILEDPLFCFWLNHVYAQRHSNYAPDEEILKDKLRQSLRQEFRIMELEDRIDITARVELLFKEFRNDVVELNEKKIRCPHFSEIAFRPTNGRVFPLFARSSNVRWLCQIARERVGEEDVAIFLEELKRFRKNVQRKIFVTLSGIDQNAKLMAQQANVQLWDLRSFNALLDLYGLPKMITIREPERKEHNGADLGALAQSLH